MSFQSNDLMLGRLESVSLMEEVLLNLLCAICVENKPKLGPKAASQVCHVASVNENKWESILEIFNVDWKRTGLINKHFRVLWISTGWVRARKTSEVKMRMGNAASLHSRARNSRGNFCELINGRGKRFESRKSTNPKREKLLFRIARSSGSELTRADSEKYYFFDFRKWNKFFEERHYNSCFSKSWSLKPTLAKYFYFLS